MPAYESGLQGEDAACRYLDGIGISVVAKRYRADGGEIDIIAMDGSITCFIEVKYRPQSRLGDGVAAVTADKRRRMRAAARKYLAAQPRLGHWRFDALEITRAGVWYAQGAAGRESETL